VKSVKYTVKMVLSAGVLVLGFGSYQAALAAPTGAYVDVAGGASYLAGSQLNNMEFPTYTITPGLDANSSAVPYYSTDFNYTGRAAFGYFFNQDPLNSWAYGVEMGYDYFSPVNSTGTQSFHSLYSTYNVSGAVKTSAWASDLDFVISEDVSEHVSLLYKLGVAYESMTRNFTATQLAGAQAGAFNSTTNSDTSGVGGLAGLGIQFNFSKHVALRTEVDGMKGGNNIGYAQALAGLVFAF